MVILEEDGKKVLRCQGIVVAVQKGKKVHIEWDKTCLREGDMQITKETLMKSKYNEHVEGGWRINLDA